MSRENSKKFTYAFVKAGRYIGPMVNEFIKNPFRWKIWLRSVQDGLRVKVKGMTIA
jgi:hypothetical protein